jgi:pilus assembly protein CpaE
MRAAAPTAQVFVRDRDSEGVLRQSFSNLNIHDAEFVTGNIETAISTLAQQPSPRLLVVDVSGVESALSRVNELAEVCEPDTGVIVVGDRNDIVFYRDLKRAGVFEYFFKPLVSDLITRACNSVLTGTAEPQAARTGRLIFVLGVRGGVGATTIAVNTAWSLAEKRQRWVMLLDFDLQNGDAALHLDVTPSHALREAIEHPERVDKLFLERAVIHVNQRLDLLASLEPLGDPIAFEESAVLSLFELLLRHYRFVFVDLPIVTASKLMKALHLPGTCVLVSNATLVSAREVARWRELIGPNTPERTTLHVVNQHGAPGSLPDPEFVRAAGRAPDVVIAYDREIAVATTLGINATKKCAPLIRGLAPLLRHLSGEPVEVPRSVLRRIFG